MTTLCSLPLSMIYNPDVKLSMLVDELVMSGFSDILVRNTEGVRYEWRQR